MSRSARSLRRLVLGVVLPATVLAAPAPGRAQAVNVVVGSVVDLGGAPLPGVEVRVLGTRFVATTGPDGRFALARVPAGAHMVMARKVGYVAESVPLEVLSGDTTTFALQLERAAQTLPAVTVEGERVALRLDRAGFYERRRFGIASPSQFVTREDIERESPLRLSDMTKRMPERARGCATSTRASYFLDGALITPPSRGSVTKTPLDFLEPGEVEGMEVYAGAAQVPAQYNMTSRPGALPGCVVLIWTR